VLRNALTHAHAQRITVTIHYEPRQLRLTVHAPPNLTR
jgi:nitrate/nitrite-specific signal transduction histidine kinase